MSNRSMLPNGETASPSARAASSVRGEVATHRIEVSPRLANAGNRYATVEPVPRPTVVAPSLVEASFHFQS